MKKENGITLIALIITIIVMLILVGVTVNVALNGGLFDTAKKASNKTQVSEEKEIIQAAHAEFLAKKFDTTSTTDTTDDFDMLEEYFLGEDREGLYVESLDYETEDGGTMIFTKHNVVFKPENIFYEEEIYVYFSYNNSDYKLTCDLDGFTKKLEVMPKLEINGATTKGNESNGWLITLENGNEYFLYNNGEVTTKWWDLEENESREDMLYNQHVAVSGTNGLLAIDDANGENSKIVKIVTIWDIKGEVPKYYFFITDQAYIGELDLSFCDIQIPINACRWYVGDIVQNQGVKNIVEYNGPSPISVEDFTGEDDDIYCRTYLERVIESFNQ